MTTRLVSVTCLLLRLGLVPDPAAVGATRPCAWPGGAAAAASITLDDGYANQWRFMAPLLEDRGFRGTFFLVSDWIDQEAHWPRWRAVAARGHEIGSHGATHRPLSSLSEEEILEELERSRRRIQAELGPAHGRCFAYPRSEADGRIAGLVKRAGYEAARAGRDELNPPAPPRMSMVRSLHPLSRTTLAEMTHWVEEAIQGGGWLVVGVHGVRDPSRPFGPTQEGWEPVPVERYAALLDRMADAGARLWVAPFGEVARYIQARQQCSITVEEATAMRIRIRLGGSSQDRTLAFETVVPRSWSQVRLAIEGRDPRAVAPLHGPGGSATPRVRYEVAPPATVVLSPVDPGPAQVEPR